MSQEYRLRMKELLRKTSLLRRLQAQTLPDVLPPIGKIHLFSEMAVTFEPQMAI